MKRSAFVAVTLLAVTAFTNPLRAQDPASPSPAAAAPAKRTEVYSVTFIHAAVGKIAALEDWSKKSGDSGPMAGHQLVLRHEAGSPWDFVAISHVGPKATVDPAGNPAGVALRPLMDWHDDTFVNGPTWSEFAKQMDLDEKTGKPKSSQSVFVVSVYRPVPGQDDALEKNLSEAPPAGDLTAGTVLLQHLEGGAWKFCTVVRYKNYADYGTSEAKAVAEAGKGTGGWFRLREVCSFHNDTIAVHLNP